MFSLLLEHAFQQYHSGILQRNIDVGIDLLVGYGALETNNKEYLLLYINSS
jgi:hypothetical protein